MSKESSSSVDANADLAARVREVEFVFQPPAGSLSLMPVPVAMLTLEAGQNLVRVSQKRIYVAVSKEQLLDLSSQISSKFNSEK